MVASMHMFEVANSGSVCSITAQIRKGRDENGECVKMLQRSKGYIIENGSCSIQLPRSYRNKAEKRTVAIAHGMVRVRVHTSPRKHVSLFRE